jgi:hypothetical protein
MNALQLERLGIKVINVRNPRILEVPGIGELLMPRGETIADIFERVYEFGFKEGIEEGKKEKAAELLKVLMAE